MNGIGERLKLARVRSRLSQRDLAARAGVSAMAISKYENNEMMPGSEVLLRLSAALDVRPEFFLRNAPSLAIEPVYRKHSRLGAKAQHAIQAQIQDWLERYLLVESLCLEEHRFEMPEGFPQEVRTLVEAEEAAAALRQIWQLGNDPINNLTELLEAKGIKVGLIAGDDNFDACTFLYNGKAPIIAVNSNRPGDRQRFDLTHELGHIMLKVAGKLDEEKAAHRFAGAFLVPAEAARQELGEQRTHLDLLELVMLKRKYGMSMGAWIYRAKDLGILSEHAAEGLWRQLSARRWRRQEPEPLPPETPGRMHRLVRRLLAERIISEARAAELMGLSLGVYLKQRTSLYDPEPAVNLHR
ncbi:MAG: ImmA/IrrE family metallo-endopeptidase [Anaerolineae bacterium]|nr:ImmA/IrrE family metallo-endopeptidase [Anaerolineae bacterium]